MVDKTTVLEAHHRAASLAKAMTEDRPQDGLDLIGRCTYEEIVGMLIAQTRMYCHLASGTFNPTNTIDQELAGALAFIDQEMPSA